MPFIRKTNEKTFGQGSNVRNKKPQEIDKGSSELFCYLTQHLEPHVLRKTRVFIIYRSLVKL